MRIVSCQTISEQRINALRSILPEHDVGQTFIIHQQPKLMTSGEANLEQVV